MKTLLTKQDQVIFKNILSALKKGNTFFITGHPKPDGDTIGSELALHSFLHSLGKRCDVYNTHPVPKIFNFLKNADKIKTTPKIDKTYDVAIILECASPERMGNIIDLKTQAKVVINIDHHMHNTGYGHINYVKTHSSSTAEIILNFLKYAGFKIDKHIAEYLYTGLVTDTGRFQQANTNYESHCAAAELVKSGFDVPSLSRQIYSTTRYEIIQLLSRALSSLKLDADGKICYMFIRNSDYVQTKTTAEDTEEFINYALRIESVQLAVLIRETEIKDETKLSFRSKGNLNIGLFVKKFDGGGHRNAAGCSLKMPIDAAHKFISKKLKESFKL